MAVGRIMPRRTRGGLAPWQVELALKRLLHDLCSDFPIGELARPCGLSRRYFTRAFKASVGTTPHRWPVDQRLRRAGELLERTDDSISAIAASCGFADQSRLNRMFHATVGASPGAWRRRRRAGLVAPVA
jgi:transcriptional regulator GlxA family with amidase domain